jgi:hypothetical protein
MEDVVWVCFSCSDGWRNFGTRRAYSFTGGQLSSGSGQGVLFEAAICGANLNYKPFPEVQPTPQART